MTPIPPLTTVLLALGFGAMIFAIILAVLLIGGRKGRYRIERSPGQVVFHKRIEVRLILTLFFGGLTSLLTVALALPSSNAALLLLAFCLPFICLAMCSTAPETLRFDLTERALTRIAGWGPVAKSKTRAMDLLYGIYAGYESYKGTRYLVGVSGPDARYSLAVFFTQGEAERFASELIAELNWRAAVAPSPFLQLKRPALKASK